METKDAIDRLAALAQETRLKAFRRLIVAGPEGLSAGVLADELAVAGPTLSFHLNHLEASGLLKARREGRQIFYSADFAAMRGLLDFLMKDCCQGLPEICGVGPRSFPPSCSPDAKEIC